jgi:hypothetical protein
MQQVESVPEPAADSPPVLENTSSRGPGIAYQLFVTGPDPVEDREPTTWREVLLPWPARVVIVVAVFAAASAFEDSGVGQQIAWGLQAGGLAAIAIIAALWWQILLVDVVFALVWLLLPFRARARDGYAWIFLHVITFVNRQFGHFAALLVWLLLALGATLSLRLQLTGVAGLLLLGMPLLNGVARMDLPWLGTDPPEKATGDLLWRRRLLIYLVTALGLLVLALRAPPQALRILPLGVALGAGTALRAFRHLRRQRIVAQQKALAQDAGAEQSASASAELAAREEFRSAQSRAAQRADAFVPLLVLVLLGVLVGTAHWLRSRLDARLAAHAAGPELPFNACNAEPHGPMRADVQMFLLADTQTHELGGARFAGETEVAQAFVASASRPTELNLLTAASLASFRSIYEQLAASRATATPTTGPLLWAHLGDLADLACQNELDRALDSLAKYGSGKLAGIAPGNHEKSFLGSFHWSPAWGTACASGLLRDQEFASAVLARFPAPQGAQAGVFLRSSGSLLHPFGGWLAAVTPLGVTRSGEPAEGASHGVIGVFLDSSDEAGFDWGLPGSLGAISEAQVEAVADAALRLKDEHTDYHDPVYVLFQHMPYAALTSASQSRVAGLIARLDANQGNPGAPSRVLAIVSAHTHRAGAALHCLGASGPSKRLVREISLGSTTDPPQQAALLSLGTNTRGQASLSIRTLQAVARPGATCGTAPGASSTGHCRQIVAQLSQHPACRPLLAPAGTPRDCQELEQPSTRASRLSDLALYAGPRDLEQRRAWQQTQARALLDCLCRDDACNARLADPLADPAYSEEVESATRARADELACLAWAASTLHAHKAHAPRMGEALRCAFDDPTLPAERIWTADQETRTCF